MKILALSFLIFNLFRRVLGTCNQQNSVELKGAVTIQGKNIVHNNRVFSEGTFWRGKNGVYYGCPCDLKPCIYLCKKGMLIYCIMKGLLFFVSLNGILTLFDLKIKLIICLKC
jgi:hypothetical protein